MGNYLTLVRPRVCRGRMNMNIEILLNALVAYFVMVDPLGVLLAFNGLTEGQSLSYRRKTAFRAVALSMLLILGFGFFGARLLGQLGITMEAFRIAGGLLLFHTAFGMVVQPDVPTKDSTHGQFNDIAVVPLAFPLIAGPGCLTLAILLFAKASQVDGGLLSTTLAITIIMVMTLAVLLMAGRIAGIMGDTANAVLKRLLGVLLAALAIQFIADGIKGLISQPIG